MPTYQFDSFLVDAENRLLLRQGEIIPITPKAFDILLLLVKRSGRILTKDEIFSEVWADTAVVEEWNLTQHIYTLRHALGEQKGRAQYIETVTRRGYRFVAAVSEASPPVTDATVSQAAAAAQPSFQQLSFRRGAIYAARFAPGGRTILYSAAFDGRRMELYSTRLTGEDHESRPLGLTGTSLLAVSSAGELAVSLKQRPLRGYIRSGTLARTSLNCVSPPRELLEHVQEAEWSPDGMNLAVVRDVAGKNRLEYPIGNVLYETGGWIGQPRFSPSGDRLAFLDHPLQNDDRGSVTVIDLTKKAEVISIGWISAQGLAWSAKGDEIWFTATKKGNARALCAVSLTGKERLVQRMAGALTLQDISADGQILLIHQNTRIGILALAPGETRERDLSWLDWSLGRDLSPDGQTLLFTEAGEGGGATYGVYLRQADGSPAVRLGNGSALALSPDGKWALARASSPFLQMVLLPTGAGEPQVLARAPLSYQQWACWFPDGARILFTANEAGRGTQLFEQRIAGGAPRCITPDTEGVHLTSPNLISPDGERVAALGPDNRIHLYNTAGGEVKEVKGITDWDVPIRWSADGTALYVYRRSELPAKIELLEIATGERRLWKEIMPPDPVGVIELLRVLLTTDGRSYAYTYTRDLSDLYVVGGVL
jgi:DNA-binding winged helix-turn-helix (wHTH) protein/dipeptidyl aminopeptidase/acylaminoacyl peptidase